MCLSAHQSPNNRSGVFSVLHSISNIVSSPPVSSCPHNERGEKDYFGTEKRIIAVKNIFWKTHIGLHIYFMKLAFKQSGSYNGRIHDFPLSFFRKQITAFFAKCIVICTWFSLETYIR
jgi:hypothetical protein